MFYEDLLALNQSRQVCAKPMQLRPTSVAALEKNPSAYHSKIVIKARACVPVASGVRMTQDIQLNAQI